MGRTRSPRGWIAFVVPFLALVSAVATASTAYAQGNGVARLEGRILDRNNKPIQNIRVQLLNDGYAPVGRTVYTDSSGRFRFTVDGGAYYVEIEPLDQPYERKRERVELFASPFSRTGEVFFEDFVLTSRERRDGPDAKPGVRFFQKVPDKAKAELENGKRLLESKPDDAYAAMRKALQIFPDYYDALELLGSEYVKAGYFDYALPILLHAVEVNPDGERSYYALGVLFYQQKYYPNAVKAFRRVLRTSPTSANALIYLGLAQLKSGDSKEAEASLQKAVQAGATNVPDVRLGLAQVYIESKRYSEAVDELQALLRENPDYADRAKVQSLIDSLRKKSA
jgi:tetratricopeptide (TPR) repeat protein